MEQNRRSVTIKDIAREAGVSIGTASNVLNGLHTVTEQNRERVMAAVKKLNYRPNQVARMLRSKQSRSIGLLLPDITNPYYPELARGVEDTASEEGYTVFLCHNDRNREKEERYLSILADKSVDGVIVVKPQSTLEQIRSYFDPRHVVLLDADETLFAGADVPHLLNCNDYDGVKQAMQYLYSQGHRRIAHITGLLESRSSRVRQAAFLDFMREHGLDRDLIVRNGRYDWQSGYDCTRELLALPQRPSAVFVANDLMAAGALMAVVDSGLRVPQDLSVVGHDDIGLASLCSPRLTTIEQPKYNLGQQSVRLLLGAIEGLKVDIRLPENRLVIRDSVRAVAEE